MCWGKQPLIGSDRGSFTLELTNAKAARGERTLFICSDTRGGHFPDSSKTEETNKICQDYIRVKEGRGLWSLISLQTASVAVIVETGKSSYLALAVSPHFCYVQIMPCSTPIAAKTL